MSLLCNAAIAEFSEKGKKLHENPVENEVDVGNEVIDDDEFGNADDDDDDDFGFGDEDEDFGFSFEDLDDDAFGDSDVLLPYCDDLTEFDQDAGKGSVFTVTRDVKFSCP
jgi:hypothetical protein